MKQELDKKFWSEDFKAIGHVKDPSVDRRIILK
jgi:hypothetical protein